MQLQRAAILITVVILVSIGLIMIYNSSAVLAGKKPFDHQPRRQAHVPEPDQRHGV